MHPVFVGGGVFEGEADLAKNRVTGQHVIENGFWPVDVVFMDIEAHEIFVIPEMLSTDKRPRVIMFQPHYIQYRKVGLREKYAELLGLMAKDYRVHVTQQMIVGLRAIAIAKKAGYLK